MRNTQSMCLGAIGRRTILSKTLSSGFNQYKGEIYPGNHEPIISKEENDKTKSELKIRDKEQAERMSILDHSKLSILSPVSPNVDCGALL